MVKLIPFRTGASRLVEARGRLVESSDSAAFPQTTARHESPLLNESSFTTDR